MPAAMFAIVLWQSLIQSLISAQEVPIPQLSGLTLNDFSFLDHVLLFFCLFLWSSYIKLTRLSDGQVITLDGSLNPDEDSTDLTRWYILNIMANQTYQLEVIPSSANPFLYKSITVDIHDMGPCNGWVTLLFRQTPNNPLILQTSDIVYQK